MKKVLVWAYLKENLGDDLFIKILLDKYKNVEYYFVNIEEKYMRPFNKYKNVKTIKYGDCIKKISTFDHYIDIGGSIFQFRNSKYGSVKKRLLIALLMKFRGKDSFILGCNFGPYKYKQSINITRLYFKLCKDVCVRDKKTYEIFKDIKSVRLKPDIVLSMGKYESGQPIKNTVGISVIELDKRKHLAKYKEKYIQSMVDLVNRLQNENKVIYLLSFSQSEGDYNSIKEIASKCNNKDKIKYIIYNGNIEKFLNEYKRLESIVACRFHSFILSLVYRQPTYPLIYSNKLLEILKDLKMDDIYTEVSECNNICHEKVIQTLNSNSILNLNDIYELANEQFKVMDKVMLK